MPKQKSTFGFMCLLWLIVGAAAAHAEIEITIGYLERQIPPPPVLSNLEEHPDDEGIAGARLGIEDQQTTGKFLGHSYKLESRIVEEDGDLSAAFRELSEITPYILINAGAQDLLSLADLPQADGALLFNISASDDRLRDADCRAALLHTIPSRAMLSDALAQFANKKRWNNWVLIEGDHEEDRAFGDALEKSAAKFRLNLAERKTWTFDADMRRNASQEVPLFTQDFPDHDMLVIADERHDFGRYVMYHSWLPRPVAGSEGMRSTAWSPAVEQHGAAQLQSRFTEATGRLMGSIDYAAWVAVRSVSEAVTRTNSADSAVVREYLFSDKFELAAFKGRKLTFRNWNGQLRQPIPLSHDRAVVALAPLEGFLHQRSELDTLGLDKPESRCTEFGE